MPAREQNDAVEHFTEADENDAVRHSTDLITSLLDHQIPLLQAFKLKWSIIAAKLADLRNLLADLDASSSSHHHPLAVDLIFSIHDTLNDAVLLADKCSTPDLADGKLRTQNDVDSLTARLDRHVRDCEVIIRSGVLLQSGVVSRKDAAVRDIVTRLQVGGAGAETKRAAAMESLLDLLQEDDKNVVIAVSEGIVPVLVKLLDSSSLEIKEKAVAVISRVSVVDSCKNALITEGLFLLNHLIRVLENGSGFSKERACIALQALSVSKENARAIGSRGGISALLAICEAGTPGSQAFAAGVLRNLAVFKGITENIVEENSVSVLVNLAASGTPLGRENAVGCLANLVRDDEEMKLLVAREGGIECLRNYWDSIPNVGSLEVGVEMLRHFASCPPIADVLVSDGFIPRVASVLNCGVLGVRIAGGKAVYELGYSSKTRKEMGECGCVGLLVEMLDGKAVEEKEAAAMALSVLLLCASNRKVFKKSDKGVLCMVQLLDPKMQNLDKRYPVSVLELLVYSKKCKKQMVAAGACVHLQKLVELEIEGAKKLLESLAKSKIWGVFSRP